MINRSIYLYETYPKLLYIIILKHNNIILIKANTLLRIKTELNTFTETTENINAFNIPF